MGSRKTYSPSRNTILIVTLLGVAATSFPVTVLSASLPVVAEDLNTSDTTAAWVITAPLLVVAVLTPMAGKLGDIYGHRRLYLIGFAGAGLLHFATALAPNIGWLIVLRTLSQVMAAPTGPAALAILMKVFPGPQRNRAMGWWGTVVAASPALGVVVGGALVDAVGWQWIFVIQGIITLAAAAAASRVLPVTSGRQQRHFDVLGAVTLGLGVAALLIATNRGPQWGWTSPTIVGGLVLGPIFLYLFGQIENRVKSPLIPLEIVRQPRVLLLFASQTLHQAAYMGGFIVAPFLLERIFGYSTAKIALLMIGRPIAFATGSAISGRTATRYRPAVVVGGSMMIVAVSLLVTGLGGKVDMIVLVAVAMSATGFGMGFGRPVIVTSIADTVSDEDLGVASGSFQMVVMLGAAIGISTLTTIIGDSTSVDRFVFVFALAAATATLASAAAFLSLRDKPIPESSET